MLFITHSQYCRIKGTIYCLYVLNDFTQSKRTCYGQHIAVFGKYYGLLCVLRGLACKIYWPSSGDVDKDQRVGNICVDSKYLSEILITEAYIVVDMI